MAKKNNPKQNPVDNTGSTFKPERSVEDQASQCMIDAAIANKIHPGITFRSRETTHTVKQTALNKIDKDLEGCEDTGKASYWKKVKQAIAPL